MSIAGFEVQEVEFSDYQWPRFPPHFHLVSEENIPMGTSLQQDLSDGFVELRDGDLVVQEGVTTGAVVVIEDGHEYIVEFVQPHQGLSREVEETCAAHFDEENPFNIYVFGGIPPSGKENQSFIPDHIRTQFRQYKIEPIISHRPTPEGTFMNIGIARKRNDLYFNIEMHAL